MGSSEGPALTVARSAALIGDAWQALEGRKQEINDLNVYPVPDGDTGTNLSLTVRNILQELAALPPETPPAAVAQAITNAALMGARGNSGVILSQIVRGAMEALGAEPQLTPSVMAGAFRRSTDVAYRAVRKPVEGTMLTVLREMTEAAEASPPGDSEQWPGYRDRVIAAGWESVRQTPLHLKVLADAGVVDAGGVGLMVLVQALIGADDLAERTGHSAAVGGPAPGGADEPALEGSLAYTYCTSFFVAGEGLEVADFEQHLMSLGDSLLVVGGNGSLKIHIHTDDPGTVMRLATDRGTLSHIEISNMREQTAERTRRLTDSNGGHEGRPLPPAHEGAHAAAIPPESESPVPASPGTLTQVVAVVAGEGNRELFSSLGVAVIVDGGQSMNPSAEELLAGVKRTLASSVLVLPNNKNIILAAEQVTGMTDQDVRVLRTRSMQAGLSALVGFDPSLPGEENLRRMRESLTGLRTAEVTRAVRDSVLDGVQIRDGEFLGLVDGRVVAASADLEPVIDAVAQGLIDEEKEVLTVLLGADAAREGVAPFVSRIQERYPDIEVEVYEGGQPHYPLLLSAE